MSVAGILLSVMVISMSLAMLEDIDHLPLSQTFKIIYYGLNLMQCILFRDGICMLVSPSAASTQVVPNGGKRKYGSGGDGH